jgi:hypothetical protein
VTSPKGGFVRERASVGGSLLGVSESQEEIINTERRSLWPRLNGLSKT